MRTAAGALSVLLGLGFGIPCVFGIAHFARTAEVWMLMGFPTYGHGPFERIGVHTSISLLLLFLAVCLAEIVLGVMLWSARPSAPTLTYVLLPVELIFWIGFALPFGPVLGLVRTALLLIATP